MAAPFVTRKREKLPLVPLRDMVVFPHMMAPFVVGRDSSIRALEAALGKKAVLDLLPMQAGDVKETYADISAIGRDPKRFTSTRGAPMGVFIVPAAANAFGKLSGEEQAKLVGRWKSGAPLSLSPHQDDPALASRNDLIAEARATCATCPVQAACWATNMAAGEAWARRLSG